ncbi:MAG TPA: MFS transporter [Candidatus Binatia bacterium]|nr:MFS transporter [Candidatus Binatia bacterium]
MDLNPSPGADPGPLYTRRFWIACAIHFTGAMSFGMFLLFPLFVRALGGDELTIGLVLGAGLAVSVACRPAVGALLDRIGRRRVLFWSGVANTMSLPLFLLLDGIGPALYALAAFHLVVGGALFASYFTYVADLVPAARRVEGIAIFGIAGMAPNGIGPALGEIVIAQRGYAGLFWVATAFAALSTVLTTRAVERGPLPYHQSGTGARRDMLRLVLRGGLLPILVATLLFGAGINAAFYFVAPFTRDLGIERAAPFFAAYASATIFLRAFGRRLPDRVGAHPIAMPAFAVFACGLALLGLLPLPGVLVAAGIACGSGHGSLFPVLNGLAVTRTPPRFHGTVVSLYTAALDAGAVVGTPLCGAIAHVAGYRTMFLVMAGASLAGLALMVADRRRHAAALVLVAVALAAPARAAAWPALDSGPLADNSFLVEEAYNQEAGVVQHIVNARWGRTSRDWGLSFTQEWPVPDETHQLSFTVPYLFAGEPAAESGAGDVLLNYRWQALAEDGGRPAVAPRVSLVLPTGSARDGIGTGSAGVELLLPVSKRLGEHFSAHANAGTRIVPHALLGRGRATHLVSALGAASLIWEPWNAVNVLCELVALREEEVEDGRVVARTRVVADPGVRIGCNAPAGVQLVWGIGLPIGLSHDAEHFAVFLYFSAEHAVTAEARRQRRW